VAHNIQPGGMRKGGPVLMVHGGRWAAGAHFIGPCVIEELSREKGFWPRAVCVGGEGKERRWEE
jgi:hypothetical protein